jgi:hypothetical protein
MLGSGAWVGAMWTLYRARSGFPAATPLEEGRRIGERGEREAAVAKSLGLEPSSRVAALAGALARCINGREGAPP